MNELNESVDYNKLDFKYLGNTKDVSFYQYIYFMKRFNEIKNNQVRFDDALKKHKELLKKLNEVKTERKTFEQEEMITNLENFYKSREEVLNFFRDYAKMMLDSIQ